MYLGSSARVVFITVAAAILTVPTSAQSAVQFELVGPSVIDYGEGDAHFIDSSLSVVQGDIDPFSGCHISGTLTVSPTDPAAGVVEIAHDPDTCRSLVRAGSIELPTSDGMMGESADYSSDIGGDSSNVLTEEGSTGPDAEPVAARRLWPRKRAKAYSAWEDPPQIDVAKSLNWVNWRPSNRCANAKWST